MSFSDKQKLLMIKLATQSDPVCLEVFVCRYRRYTREFGSGCSIVIRERSPETDEIWDRHYMSNSKNRPLAIERAKKIAHFLVESGATNVRCKAAKG